MPPSEFWASHPEETLEWCRQADRQDAELAWQIALMNCLGRAGKLPKTPDEMFKEREEEWSDELLLQRAQNLKTMQELEAKRGPAQRTKMRPVA